jgi:AGCS family alanine or glycine:cation symporter
MERVLDFLNAASDFVWGPWLLIPLLLGTGVFLTIRLGFVQFRTLGSALRLGLIDRKDAGSEGDISQFQALTTALAATVGTGNIVGVATAVGIGGPGALFWMWITGILGLVTKYSESFLSVRFRGTDAAGEKSGGPQFYLERGIRGPVGKILGIMFAIFAVIACFGIGNMTQGNSISANLENTFSIPTWVTGLVLTIAVMVILVGGIKSIGNVSAKIVPAMIILYLAAQIWVLMVNADALPSAFAAIFTDAFTGTSAAGGFIGAGIMAVIQMGVARGLFSNESGLGSSPIAAAAAQTSHPTRQGLVSMTQTFIDTIIMVTITGLMLIATGTWQATDGSGDQLSEALMVSEALNSALPGDLGGWIVSLCILLFAGTTILGWCYYGERNIERLFGRKLVMPFRIFFSLVVYVGCTVELDVVWAFSDVANGLMALPNLVGLLLLSGLIARETRYYLKHDPKLRATTDEIEEFMADQPGWEEWKAGNEIGSSHHHSAYQRRE